MALLGLSVPPLGNPSLPSLCRHTLACLPESVCEIGAFRREIPLREAALMDATQGPSKEHSEVNAAKPAEFA